MKRIYLKITFALVLLICLNGLQAQTTQTNLNQIELMKQFIGSWKSEFVKDTTEFWEAKPYGKGLECYFKYVTKEKIVLEGKQLWGYDKKIDKIILSSMVKGMDIGINVVWFTSQNKYVVIPFGDISNPEKASSKWEGEFKSPDMFLETTLVNTKTIRTNTYTRVNRQ